MSTFVDISRAIWARLHQAGLSDRVKRVTLEVAPGDVAGALQVHHALLRDTPPYYIQPAAPSETTHNVRAFGLDWRVIVPGAEPPGSATTWASIWEDERQRQIEACRKTLRYYSGDTDALART